MIGSIGCSGGTGSQDQAVRRAGANAVNESKSFSPVAPQISIQVWVDIGR